MSYIVSQTYSIIGFYCPRLGHRISYGFIKNRCIRFFRRNETLS